MEARDAELKKELDATLHARRELGDEYESALVDSFLGKVEQRLDGTIDRRMRRRHGRAADGRGPRLPRARQRGGLMGRALRLRRRLPDPRDPLSAIGVANADLPGLFVTWAGIVGVNGVHAMRGMRFGRRGDRGGRKSEWDD